MVSKEVLNIVLAVVILWVGIFTCWVLYYAARILQQGYGLFKEFNDKLKRIDQAIQSIKERFEHSATYLGLVAEGIKELGRYLAERKQERPKKQSKKRDTGI